MRIKKIGVETCVVALLLGSGCMIWGNAHERKGDNYFRAGRYEDAWAEYSIALRQRGEDNGILLKMGRTALLRKDLKGMREVYFSLLRLSPEESNHVALDFFRLGVNFYESGDDVQMAGAFESLFEVDSTYNIGEYYYYLADYYYEHADFSKAATYYMRALSYRPAHEKADSATYRLALSNEKLENYRDALVFFEQYMKKFPGGSDIKAVEWHRGLCAYHVAQEEFDEGHLREALEYVEVPIDSGQPQVTEDDAWFLKGEIYHALDRPDSALVAYDKVLNLNPSRTGRLVSLSQERIREIKFGR